MSASPMPLVSSRWRERSTGRVVCVWYVPSIGVREERPDEIPGQVLHRVEWFDAAEFLKAFERVQEPA